MRLKHRKLVELAEELRTVVFAKRSWGDAIGPPLVFVLGDILFDVWIAIACAASLSIVLALLRLAQHRPLRYALGGLGSVAVASLIALLLSRGEGFFIPGMIRGAVTALICLVSVIFKRPLVAWTSFMARRWPLEWYWHPRVRPAYSEVSLAWFVFFVGRLIAQYILFQRGATLALGTVNLILGWPALILLLIGSYLYGLWRLRRLHGPSVQEFRDEVPPPWSGQQRGF